jgi:hypothetical protein
LLLEFTPLLVIFILALGFKADLTLTLLVVVLAMLLWIKPLKSDLKKIIKNLLLLYSALLCFLSCFPDRIARGPITI